MTLGFIVLPIFIFIGLTIFLRYILSRNVTSATGHLQEMSKDYAVKQEEIEKRLKEAKDESKKIHIQAKHEAEELRQKAIKEGYEERDRIIKETHQKTERMVEQAERACEFLKQEENEKIERGSLRKAGELIREALPDRFLRQVHSLWMEESKKGEFQLGRINLPDNIKEVRVSSAFPLTGDQREDLHGRLKKRLGPEINLKEDVDPGLIAGFVITAGSVVIDASLKDEIKEKARKK